MLWFDSNTQGQRASVWHKKTASFTKSQQAFTDAIIELKAQGKPDVDSYPEIIKEDTRSQSARSLYDIVYDITDTMKFHLIPV